MESKKETARVAGIVEDSIVDGKGIRLAVFLQGCEHGCKGCHNQETWSLDGGEEMELDSILSLLEKNPICSGITLTGGEPLLQPKACAYLAKRTKELGKDVWLYTGYYLRDVKSDAYARENILPYVDVLVDGPYMEHLKSLNKAWVGSLNQTVHVLNKKKSPS